VAAIGEHANVDEGSSTSPRLRLLSIGSATMAFLTWLVMGQLKAPSNAAIIATIAAQAMFCMFAASLAGAYLRRVARGAARKSYVLWVVLVGTSSWFIFLVSLTAFLRLVAND
jgi:hypothetical protein